MRTLLIFFSIGVFFTLIQFSYGAPSRPVSMESAEDDSVEEKAPDNLKSFSDSQDQSPESDENIKKSKSNTIQITEDDQSSEEKKKIVEALELTRKPEESNSHSDEQDKDDNVDLPNVVNNDYGRILRDSDED